MVHKRNSTASKLALLRLAKELCNVSLACRIEGTSRDTFYRYAKLYSRGGATALKEQSRRRPVRKNRVSPKVEEAVVRMAFEQPAWGQARVADELGKHAIRVSPAGVRSIWMRHDLHTRQRRITALEAKHAQDDFLPSATQSLALEKASLHSTASAELGSKYPGQCGVQDAIYVGSPKGPGRLYQQSFVDIYSKLAFAGLYPRNDARTSVDLLKHHVVPFFQAHQVPLRRVLTDRGPEYCGDSEPHAYEQYLANEHIAHSKAEPGRSRTMSVCAAFERTVRDEFYHQAFRRKHYRTLKGLQRDLDRWVIGYNNKRPQPGRYCYGKTPMRTFLDSVPLASGSPRDRRINPDRRSSPRPSAWHDRRVAWPHHV